MGMSCSLRLVQRFRCGVCRQLLNEERAASDVVNAALFGAARYSLVLSLQAGEEGAVDRGVQAPLGRVDLDG